MQGQALGRYRLRGVLGQGGMGRLYVAEQEGIEGFSKIVALKQILPHLADSPQFRRMFLTEARVAARLEHPNIVVTYELGEVDGVHFISMEYLPGEDLSAVLSRGRETGPIPVEIAAAIAHQALSGLQYAHELRDNSGRPVGLVHRDVNPSNIFVTYYGMVKLLDFGVVKGGSTVGTNPGTFKGKYGYCAPEQLNGDAIDPRTDIFCVGIVLWECLTGQRLFKGQADPQVMDAVRAQAIALPSLSRPGIPAELEEVTMRSLSRDRSRRYQSAYEMSEALDRFLGSRPQRPTAKTIGQWLEASFGVQRALLKKAIAQGNDIESSLEQLNAMANPRPPVTGAGPPLSGARPNLQPRTLWSTSVRKPGEPEPRPASVAAPLPPPAPNRTFVEIGSEADGKPDEGATSRFSVPQELAEAAGRIPGRASTPLPPPPPLEATLPPMVTTPPPPAAALPMKGGGQALKIIAIVGALGAGAVLFLTLRDSGAPTKTLAPVNPNSGTVTLESDPPGAHVLLDGEPTGLSTPTVLRNLRPGKVFEIRLDKPGFQTAVEKVEADPNGPVTRTIKLQAGDGAVVFEALPEGASVYIDDVLTEARGGPVSVPLGRRKLRVEHEGEVVVEKLVEIKAGEAPLRVRVPGRK